MSVLDNVPAPKKDYNFLSGDISFIDEMDQEKQPMEIDERPDEVRHAQPAEARLEPFHVAFGIAEHGAALAAVIRAHREHIAVNLGFCRACRGLRTRRCREYQQNHQGKNLKHYGRIHFFDKCPRLFIRCI